MKVLVLGNDGRAHALVWKLFNSPQSSDVLCAPGNGGTSQLAPQVDRDLSLIAETAHWAFKQDIDIIIPAHSEVSQLPLLDEARTFGIAVCGPMQSVAHLEQSRCAMKEFLLKHNLPTANGRAFTDLSIAERYLAAQQLPVVLKADNRTVGGGIYEERYAALQALRELFEARPLEGSNNGVIIEAYLAGSSVSMSALTDGTTVLPFLPTRIYERLNEGDTGPPAPGMGAHTSNSTYAQKLTAYFQQHILRTIVQAMEKESCSYQGILSVDCIITNKGPRITSLHFAMQDQEAQVVLPRMEDDLLSLVHAAATKRLYQYPTITWKDEASVGITLVAEGYPHHFPTGSPIDGLTDLDKGVLLFHHQTHNPMGMRYDDFGSQGTDPLAGLIMGLGSGRTSAITTTGGKVLTLVTLAGSLNGARGRAVLNAERIKFAGRYYRGDIGMKEFA
jgi:phosphoribosylamine--glycine ligase